ncbi:FGGY-family carbohydrate kinase [Pseudonocardia sp. NPDC049635]|uniref:FGGY-family carbohydrate kinase n=1 Tax=Pseudonocardia sp. NPDC049635 TaxID=3155506 RepID=UPI0033EFCECF
MAERARGRVWVGIDLGTQSVRALSVDDVGTQLARAARPLTSRRGDSHHEQDPARWWAATADALAEMSAGLAPADRAAIGAVAVAGTSGTVLLTGRDGTPCTPGLMYDDARAAALVPEAAEAGAELWSRLGHRMQPSWALPKLLWWRDQGLLTPGVRLAHQPDVVTARLAGGPVATDTSHALKSGFDQLAGRWPEQIMADLGIDPEMLPPVVRSGTVLGTVCPAAAARTGLPAGTPVVAGMTDGCAAQLGAGTLTRGAWNCVLGTTLAVKGVSRQLLGDPTGAVYSHRAPHDDDGPLWFPGGASNTGAGVVTALFPGRDLGRLTAQAATRTEVPLCYPLAGRGERFPFVAPEARGFGIPPSGDEATVFAAVCHGVAHVERLCFDLLDQIGAEVGTPITLTGGASANRWWNQLRCDLLGTPVTVPRNAEPAAGMAVLAAGASGTGLVGAARLMVHTDRVLHPDPRRHADLAEAHVRFVTELRERGWIDQDLAAHATTRTERMVDGRPGTRAPRG